MNIFYKNSLTNNSDLTRSCAPASVLPYIPSTDTCHASFPLPQRGSRLFSPQEILVISNNETRVTVTIKSIIVRNGRLVGLNHSVNSGECANKGEQC